MYSTGSYSALEVFVELTRESSSYNMYLAIPIVMVSLSSITNCAVRHASRIRTSRPTAIVT